MNNSPYRHQQPRRARNPGRHQGDGDRLMDTSGKAGFCFGVDVGRFAHSQGVLKLSANTRVTTTARIKLYFERTVDRVV